MKDRDLTLRLNLVYFIVICLTQGYLMITKPRHHFLSILQTLTGNTNWRDVIKHSIPVIQAQYIRLYPLKWHIWPCTRMEIYGEPWPQGDKMRKKILSNFCVKFSISNTQFYPTGKLEENGTFISLFTRRNFQRSSDRFVSPNEFSCAFTSQTFLTISPWI